MRRTLTALATAWLCVGVVACGGGSSVEDAGASSAATTPVTVKIENFAFQPGTITVPAGAPLMIMNEDDQPHTITSDSTGTFDTGSIAAHAAPAQPVVVMQPGTFPFHCSFHPFMHGTLVVR